MDILNDISDCIIKASTTLSDDKYAALNNAIVMEDNDNACWALNQILENYQIAQKTNFPLCDDTGIPHVIIEIGEEREISGELLNQTFCLACGEAVVADAESLGIVLGGSSKLASIIEKEALDDDEVYIMQFSHFEKLPENLLTYIPCCFLYFSQILSKLL